MAQLETLGGIARELLYAILSVRLASHKIMKAYNTKLAMIVFTAIVALNAVWYFLGHWISGDWLVYPIGVINSPGIPLFSFLAVFVRAGYLSDGILIVACVLFSAFVWSLISGFVFRRKYAA